MRYHEVRGADRYQRVELRLSEGEISCSSDGVEPIVPLRAEADEQDRS